MVSKVTSAHTYQAHNRWLSSLIAHRSLGRKDRPTIQPYRDYSLEIIIDLLVFLSTYLYPACLETRSCLSGVGCDQEHIMIMGTFCFLDALVGVVVVGFCDVGLQDRLDLDFFCLSLTTST